MTRKTAGDSNHNSGRKEKQNNGARVKNVGKSLDGKPRDVKTTPLFGTGGTLGGIKRKLETLNHSQRRGKAAIDLKSTVQTFKGLKIKSITDIETKEHHQQPRRDIKSRSALKKAERCPARRTKWRLRRTPQDKRTPKGGTGHAQKEGETGTIGNVWKPIQRPYGVGEHGKNRERHIPGGAQKTRPLEKRKKHQRGETERVTHYKHGGEHKILLWTRTKKQETGTARRKVKRVKQNSTKSHRGNSPGGGGQRTENCSLRTERDGETEHVTRTQTSWGVLGKNNLPKTTGRENLSFIKKPEHSKRNHSENVAVDHRKNQCRVV